MSQLVEKILDKLQSQAEMTVSLLDALLPFDPYNSSRRLERLIWRGPKPFKTKWSDRYQKRQKFYNTLNYLKRTGLVGKREEGSKSVWKITPKGRKRLKELKKRKENPFSKIHTHFAKLRGEEITIVVFDIPEYMRKSREWLRICLTEMGFQYLQKSVWVGRGVVDEDFIYALRERDMLEFVHIFSVNRSGTIKEVMVLRK